MGTADPFVSLEDCTPPQPPAPTVAELLEAYGRTYLPQLAPQTQIHHRVVFRRLCRHYGDLPLTAITPAWLRQWREEISPGHTLGTVRQYLLTLSGALSWAVEDGWLVENPMRTVRRPPEPPWRVRFLSPDERQRLLCACQQSANAFLSLLVVLALSTGCRRNELCRLRWQNVDLERGMVRLATTKNKHPRAVPVTGLALALLRAHTATQRAGVDWLFPRADGQRPVLIEQAWRTARRRAGLVDFRFHDLRHSAASALAMNGATLLEIAEVLGHKKVTTPPAQAGGFVRTKCMTLTAASCTTHEFTTSTLACKGPVQALEHLPGDTSSSASKPGHVRVVSLLCGTTFTQTPTVCNPAKLC